MILSDLEDGTELLLLILETVLDSLQSQESLPSLVAQRIGVLHQAEAVLGRIIAQHTVQRSTIRHGPLKLLQVLRRKERGAMASSGACLLMCIHSYFYQQDNLH